MGEGGGVAEAPPAPPPPRALLEKDDKEEYHKRFCSVSVPDPKLIKEWVDDVSKRPDVI